MTLEHEEYEDVADEERRLEDRPEEARITGHGVSVAVDREEETVTCPGKSSTSTYDGRGYVEEFGARVEEGSNEKDIARAADDDAGTRAGHGDEGRSQPVAEGEDGVDDGQADVTIAIEVRVIVVNAVQDGFLWIQREAVELCWLHEVARITRHTSLSIINECSMTQHALDCFNFISTY